MSISSITQSDSTSTIVQQPKTDAQKASLNYDSFLKLMLEQLKNQDPTAPTDQAQTLAQLASFSSVEQSIKINDKLNSMLNQQGASQAANLIGKTVTSLTSSDTGKVESVEVNSEGTFVNLDTGAKIAVSQGIRIS